MLAVDKKLLQKTITVIKHLKVVKYYLVFILLVIENKSTTVSDSTIPAERFSDFFKNLIKKIPNASKKWQKNVLKNPGRALAITANITRAAVTRNSKSVISTLPELITLCNAGKELYLGKFV